MKRRTDNIGHDAHFWGCYWRICFDCINGSSSFRIPFVDGHYSCCAHTDIVSNASQQ
jgi:hypothetical protein